MWQGKGGHPWLVFRHAKIASQSHNEHFDRQRIECPTQLLITSATGNKDHFRKFVQDNLTSHNLLELDSKDENKGLLGVTHFYSQQPNKDELILSILEKVAKI